MAFQQRNLTLDECNRELDFDGRTDGQPVYVGKAPAGAKTTDAAWTIWKFTYSGDDCIRQRIGIGANGKTKHTWESRTALDYSV